MGLFLYHRYIKMELQKRYLLSHMAGNDRTPRGINTCNLMPPTPWGLPCQDLLALETLGT